MRVQTIVFGNSGGESGSGVAFTRNPAIGTKELYFDFQFNAQGEDVVSAPQHLGDKDRLCLVLPDVWARLNEICPDLEIFFRDAEDFEFTIQSGVLFLLQARRTKCTDWAALAIAVDLVEEGLLSPAEALAHLDGIDLCLVACPGLETNLKPSMHDWRHRCERRRFPIAGWQYRGCPPGPPHPLDRAPRARPAAIATWGC